MANSSALWKTFGPTLDGVVNVKTDHGAVGDGVTDDTAAIQAAIDACFGAEAVPPSVGGFDDPLQNSPLYFPAGTYRVTQSLRFVHVLGGVIFGDGSDVTRIVFDGNVPPNAFSSISFTGATNLVNVSNHGYVAGDRVQFYSATATGVYSGFMYYVLSSGLTTNAFKISYTNGGSEIDFADGTGFILVPLFDTNGFRASYIEGLCLDMGDGTVEGTVALNLDHKFQMGGNQTNGNRHYDVWVKNAYVGVLLGLNSNGNLSSEMSFYECKFHDCGYSGLRTTHFNALMEQCYNCEFVRCGNLAAEIGAISAQAGSVQVNCGTTFEDSAYADIKAGGGEGYLMFQCNSTNSQIIAGSDNGPLFGLLVCPAYIRECTVDAPNDSLWQIVSQVSSWCNYSHCTFGANGRFINDSGARYYIRDCVLGANYKTSVQGTIVQDNTAEPLAFPLDYDFPSVLDLFEDDGPPPILMGQACL